MTTNSYMPEDISLWESERYSDEYLIDENDLEQITEDMGDDLNEIRIYERDRMERFIRNNSI